VNPNLWHFCNDFLQARQQFPTSVAGSPYVSGTTHPELGSAASGSPMNLQALIDNPATSTEVRSMARATLAHYSAAFTQTTSTVPAPPSAPATLFRAHTGPLTHVASQTLVSAAQRGDFRTVSTTADAILATARRGGLSETDARQSITALGQAAQEAAARGEWSTLDVLLAVLLAILTLGVGTAVMGENRAVARRTEQALRNTEESARDAFMWREAGHDYAQGGGQIVADFRATHDPDALRTNIRTGLEAQHSDWTGARLDQVSEWIFTGVRDADAAHDSAAPNAQPQLGTADPAERAARGRLLTARAEDLGGIAAGSLPVNHMSDPAAMVGIMGFGEIDAQISAEISRANTLLADPALDATARRSLTDVKRNLILLQSETRRTSEAFELGRRPAEGQEAALITLRANLLTQHGLL